MLVSMFSNKDRYKVNIQKSILSLNTSNKKGTEYNGGKDNYHISSTTKDNQK